MSHRAGDSESCQMPDGRGLDFQNVYVQFHARIHRYLQRLVGPGEADDLTQEVFARASRALAGFRGECKVSTWLHRIAKNAALDRLRRPSFRPLSLQIARRASDSSEAIEQALVRKEASECIRRYIDALPPGYRSVVLLSEHAGLTNQEIAEALGVTLETVKIRLHRARARLRKDLGDGCTLYRDDRNELSCEPRTSTVSSPD